jgi:hypothetical protein
MLREKMSLPKMLSIRSVCVMFPFRERPGVVTGARASRVEDRGEVVAMRYTIAVGAAKASSRSDMSGSGRSVYTGLER